MIYNINRSSCYYLATITFLKKLAAVDENILHRETAHTPKNLIFVRQSSVQFAADNLSPLIFACNVPKGSQSIPK